MPLHMYSFDIKDFKSEWWGCTQFITDVYYPSPCVQYVIIEASKVDAMFEYPVTHSSASPALRSINIY